jgi:predicted NBD/HSP70 family sugar kinase
MTPPRPTLDVVRSLTDEHVVRALMEQPRLTRAGIAGQVGISKPTASESVRRLTEAGLLRDTGERTTGRGRVGSYYALADDIGTALVVSIAPEGIVAECLDVYGEVRARAERVAALPAHPDQVSAALRSAAEEAVAGSAPVRLAVVSAADPVDRATGRLVHLPDAPFLVGELSPAETLSPLVEGAVHVDNDVNWAARAERDATGGLDDFVYLYLGEGVGCAVVADGDVRRGHAGLAGEIAHLVVPGPRGRAMPFTEVFAALDVRQPGTTAIDVPRILQLAADHAGRTLADLARAVCGVVAAVVALADPQVIVIGGPWGRTPAFLAAVEAEVACLPRQVPLHAAEVSAEPPLTGARQQALQSLRSSVLQRTHLG